MSERYSAARSAFIAKNVLENPSTKDSVASAHALSVAKEQYVAARGRHLAAVAAFNALNAPQFHKRADTTDYTECFEEAIAAVSC